MIAAGDVNAVIDEEAGMVRFKDDVDGGSVSIEALQERMSKVVDMQRRLVEASRAIQLEPKYVGNLLRQDILSAGAGTSGGAGVPDAADLPPDAMDDS